MVDSDSRLDSVISVALYLLFFGKKCRGYSLILKGVLFCTFSKIQELKLVLGITFCFPTHFVSVKVLDKLSSHRFANNLHQVLGLCELNYCDFSLLLLLGINIS